MQELQLRNTLERKSEMFSKCAEEEADKQKQYRFQNTTLRHTVSKRSERGPEIKAATEKLHSGRYKGSHSQSKPWLVTQST